MLIGDFNTPPVFGATKSRLGSSIRDLTKRGSSRYNNLEEDVDRGMVEIMSIQGGGAGVAAQAKDAVRICLKDPPSSAPPPPPTHLNVHRRNLPTDEVRNLRVDPNYEEVVEDHAESCESPEQVINLRRQTLSTSSLGAREHGGF